MGVDLSDAKTLLDVEDVVEPSQIRQLCFQGRLTFYLHESLLNKSPKLASLLKYPLGYKGPIIVNDIPDSTGHVLVHFLCSGNYQCLKLRDRTEEETIGFELSVALDTCIAARSLELPDLQSLAEQEAVRLGERTSITSLIEIIEFLDMRLDIIPKIAMYLQDRLLRIAHGSSTETGGQILSHLTVPKTASMVLLKALVIAMTKWLTQKAAGDSCPVSVLQNGSERGYVIREKEKGEDAELVRLRGQGMKMGRHLGEKQQRLGSLERKGPEGGIATKGRVQLNAELPRRPHKPATSGKEKGECTTSSRYEAAQPLATADQSQLVGVGPRTNKTKRSLVQPEGFGEKKLTERSCNEMKGSAVTEERPVAWDSRGFEKIGPNVWRLHESEIENNFATVDDQGPLRISRSILKKCPKLASRLEGPFFFSKPRGTIDIEDISYDTGHIVIHFLITGKYQCLKPKGDTDDERNISQLATAFRTYATAVDLDLELLQDLAEGEIQQLEDKMNLVSFAQTLDGLDLALDHYPKLATRLKTRIFLFSIRSPQKDIDDMVAQLGAPKKASMVFLQYLVQTKSLENDEEDAKNASSEKKEEEANGDLQRKAELELVRLIKNLEERQYEAEALDFDQSLRETAIKEVVEKSMLESRRFINQGILSSRDQVRLLELDLKIGIRARHLASCEKELTASKQRLDRLTTLVQGIVKQVTDEREIGLLLEQQRNQKGLLSADQQLRLDKLREEKTEEILNCGSLSERLKDRLEVLKKNLKKAPVDGEQILLESDEEQANSGEATPTIPRPYSPYRSRLGKASGSASFDDLASSSSGSPGQMTPSSSSQSVAGEESSKDREDEKLDWWWRE
ncbi:hypothetical protein F66182_8020 [Fusarium sp. NRRL 66182]|nr:hypothetical protein F66182_8020 [Fusarium sp. NRRL 66182]